MIQILCLAFNCITLLLSSILAHIFVLPAVNHFIQYSSNEQVLPYLTELSILLKNYLFLIVIFWSLSTIYLARRCRDMIPLKQVQLVALHTSATLLLNLGILSVYALAGVLPYLYISAPI